METYCSESTTELAAAMIEVQKQMAPAMKDAINPFVKSKYATLNSVMESCSEALISNGIWLTQLPVPAPVELGPGHIGLLTKLTHAESGQWQSSLTVIPLPKADPQGMGSAITYGRRYALTAMLGMITEDDDGEAAKMPSKASSKAKNDQYQQKHASNQQMSTNPASPADNRDKTEFPQLDGVTFQRMKAQDGRPCIIATGNTQPKKDILRGMGFYWNSQRRIWWKYADVA